MAITYTPTTNFGAKDSLPSNDPDKVIKGSEFSVEFTAIQTAFGLAASAASPTFTGTVTIPTADINGGAIDGTVIGAVTPAAASFTTVSATGNITVGGTVDGRDVAADGTKLDGIEAGADVTDTTNVTAAGALMDSELTNIAAVKALNQGVATTDSPSFAGLTATTADINGGTIDGVTIGGSSAGAITGTTGQFDTSLNVDGTVTADGLTSSEASEIFSNGFSGGETPALRLSNTSAGVGTTATLELIAGSSDTSTNTRKSVIENISTTSSGSTLNLYTTPDGTNIYKRMYLANNGDISFYEDTGTTPKFEWSASNERLTLKTSGAYALDVQASGTASVTMAQFSNSNGSDKAYIALDSTGAGKLVLLDGGNNEDVLIRAQSDSYYNTGGNFYFGKTLADLSTVGIEARAVGLLSATRDSDIPFIARRNTTDGDIAVFYKDGTTVGSIGTGFTGLGIGSGNTNVLFYNPTASINPSTNVSGTASDGLIGLGSSGARFKDLYLSGGVYLGGTGAANLLDDYEEGTWTPTIDAGASGFGGSPTVAGAYVKIGDLVHVKFFYENTWTTTGAAFQIGGLPFTPSTSGTSWTAVGCISGSGVTINGSSVASVYVQLPLGGAEQYKVKGIAQDNTLAYLLTATTAKAIEGTLTYRAA